MLWTEPTLPVGYHWCADEHPELLLPPCCSCTSLLSVLSVIMRSLRCLTRLGLTTLLNCFLCSPTVSANRITINSFGSQIIFVAITHCTVFLQNRPAKTLNKIKRSFLYVGLCSIVLTVCLGVVKNYHNGLAF